MTRQQWLVYVGMVSLCLFGLGEGMVRAQTEAPAAPGNQTEPPAESPDKPAENAPPQDPAQNPPNAPPNDPQAEGWKSFWQGLFGQPRETPERRRISDPRAPVNAQLASTYQAALKQIRAGKPQIALELFQRLLDQPNDTLYEVSRGKFVTLRSEIQRQMQKFPSAMQEKYQQQQGAAAKLAYDSALAENSVESMSRVASRFLMTPAGAEAANWLASWHLSRGEYGLASRWMTELAVLKAPLTKDPLWRLKAEFVARRTDSQSLKKGLLELTSVVPKEVTLGGEPRAVSSWLEKFSRSHVLPTPVLSDWRMFFGNAQHVGRQAGGEPLPLLHWQLPLTEQLPLQRLLEEIRLSIQDGGQHPIPASEPLVIGPRVAFRSLAGVKVVDARTGKLLWQTTSEKSPEVLFGNGQRRTSGDSRPNFIIPQMRPFNPFGPAESISASELMDHALGHLLFRHANYGLLSSDGERLFVLEEMPLPADRDVGEFFGEEAPEGDPLGQSLSANRLTAYDLRSGRSLWEVGGASLNDPFELPLAGTFFFGPPVVVGSELFVVGETNSEIRLLVLEASTGELRWSQTIARAPVRIALDLARQWSTAQVAVDQGIIVCPTTVGWLLAIERNTRHLLWAQRYQETEGGTTEGEVTEQIVMKEDLDETWRASPPMIVGQRVIFAPPERGVLLGLDLYDGRVVWQHARKNGLYVAGVFDSKVVVVSTKDLVAMDAITGKEVWRLPFKNADWSPVGRGVAVGDRYLIPSSNGVLQIANLSSGKWETDFIIPTRDNAVELGNLVLGPGLVFSLGTSGLTAFEQKAAVEAQLTENLKTNPQDPTMLIHQAELQLAKNLPIEAWATLQKIPTQGHTASVLETVRKTRFETYRVMCLAKAIPEIDLRLLQELSSSPREKFAVDRLRLLAQLEKRDFDAALATTFQIVQNAPQELFPHDSDPLLRLHPDNWLSGTWQAFEEDLVPDQKLVLAARLQAEAEKTLQADLVLKERFLQIFDHHPLSIAVRWKVIEEHLTAGHFGAAEVHLWSLFRWPSEEPRAWRKLGELWQERGLIADAAFAYRQLEEDFVEAQLSPEQTVAQYLEQRRGANQLPTMPSPPGNWHGAELGLSRSGSQFRGEYETETIHLGGIPFYRWNEVNYRRSQQQLEIVDAATRVPIWMTGLRSHEADERTSRTNGRTLAHLLVIQGDGRLVVASPIEKRILWSEQVEQTPDVSEEEWSTAAGSQPNPVGLRDLRPQVFENINRNRTWRQTLNFVNARSVGYRRRRQLVVRDLLTGEIRWTREDVPQDQVISGGERVALLTTPGKRKIRILNMTDGRDVTSRRLIAEDWNQGLQLIGDLLLTKGAPASNAGGDETTPLVLKRVGDGQVLWTQPVPSNSLAQRVHWKYLLVAQRSGELQLLNLATGKTRPLEGLTGRDLRNSNLYSFSTTENLYLVINKNQLEGRDLFPESLPSLRVSGAIQAWNLNSGKKIWRQTVSNQNLVLQHQEISPVLTFASRRYMNQPGGIGWQLNLLVIDQYTGGVVHQSQMPSQGGFHMYNVDLSGPYVELRSYNERVRLSPKTSPANNPAQ